MCALRALQSTGNPNAVAELFWGRFPSKRNEPSGTKVLFFRIILAAGFPHLSEDLEMRHSHGYFAQYQIRNLPTLLQSDAVGEIVKSQITNNRSGYHLTSWFQTGLFRNPVCLHIYWCSPWYDPTHDRAHNFKGSVIFLRGNDLEQILRDAK